MQTIWKGTVSFGLVSIPVRLYSATEERDVSFRQVHREDGGRIRYRRVCEADGEEVSYGDIAKGYEMPDGQMVILEKIDFDSLPLPSSKAIDVLQFIPVDQVDPLMVQKSYYVSAEGPGAKPYVLLRDALESTGRAAVVKVALRNREQLAALRVRGDVLVLQTLLWPDEVRDASGIAPDEDITVRDQEIAMAESYIETLTGDFEPEQFTDEYRHALEELIEAKVTGGQVETPGAPAATEGNVVDLMAALRASVDAAKARRAAGASEPEAAAEPAKPTRRRTPAVADDDATARAAKKTPARKAATKAAGTKAAGTGKAPAKKATATKAPAAKTTTAKTTTAKKTATKKAATRKSA
ncbi:MAG: Ku protein [Motilibacteraceae bacterium]